MTPPTLLCPFRRRAARRGGPGKRFRQDPDTRCRFGKAGFSGAVADNGLRAAEATASGLRRRADGMPDAGDAWIRGHGRDPGVRGCTERRVPTTALTASARQANREHCLAARMDDYLSKRINVGELFETLDRWVWQRKPVKDKEGLRALTWSSRPSGCSIVSPRGSCRRSRHGGLVDKRRRTRLPVVRERQQLADSLARILGPDH